MINISEMRIDASTFEGENVRGELRIESDDHARIRGMVFSDSGRIVTDIDRFEGRDVRIRYGVDIRDLQAGTTLTGTITIAAEGGEYSIPCTVRIREALMKSEFGNIRSLNEFVQLARTDYEEAFRMFRSDAFAALLKGKDAIYEALYRGLSANPATMQKMEEFLILAEKKEKVEVRLLSASREHYGLNMPVEETVTIRRSGWGHLNLELRSDADFLYLPKTRLSEDDFVGSVADLPYRIQTDLIGSGVRTGMIELEYDGSVQTLSVTASRFSRNRVDRGVLGRKDLALLSEAFLSYKTEEIGIVALLDRSLPLLNEMRELGEDPVFVQVMEAYVRFLNKDSRELIRLLHEIKDYDFSKENLEIRALYLYLAQEAGLLSEEMVNVPEQIREWLLRQRDSFILTELFLKTSPSAARLPLVQLKTLKETFAHGSRSPFLYAKALKILTEDGSQLNSIDEFTRQVLCFGARRGLLTEDLALRCAFLSDNEKSYSPVLFRVLTSAYEEFPLDGILEAVCRLIMKGPSRDYRAFSWYAQAVDKNIRVTRLYEYYIETLPDGWQKIFPLPIRKYFSYNDTLSDLHRAAVFANIVRNRLEDPETFENYREKAEAFALGALLKNRISLDYAALYQEFITTVPDEETARHIVEILFSEYVYSDDRDVRNVVVIHKELKDEQVVPLIRGGASIRRFTPDAEILFEDAKGRRRRTGIPYSVETLLEVRRYEDDLKRLNVSADGIVLNRIKNAEVISENLKDFQRAALSDAFTQEYRREVRKKLLHFYAAGSEEYDLEDTVRALDDRLYVEADKVSLVEVLLLHGFYQRAFRLINVYGPEGVGDGQLVRLTSRMIEEGEFTEDEDLLILAEYIFRRGKFDERILSYLVSYYNGSISNMCRVRDSANQFYVETYALDERILARALFSHLNVPGGTRILRHYIKKGGRKKLIRSYLALASEWQFDSDEPVDDYLGKCLSDLYDDRRLDQVMKLTLLKYDSQQESLSVHQEAEVDSLLEDMMSRHLLLGFYQNLPKSFISQYQLEDKVFAEIKADPNSSVTLFYRLDSGISGVKEESFRSEPLEPVYRGIFQKIFTLFYGEKLTYYAVIDDGTEERVTDKVTVSSSFTDLSGKSRYQRINRMLKLEEDGKAAELAAEIRDYKKQEQIISQLFRLREEDERST